MVPGADAADRLTAPGGARRQSGPLLITLTAATREAQALRFRAFLLLLLPWTACGAEETLRIAVAASFRATLEKIVPRFESSHPARCRISSAATGVLYAQLVNGADFDLLLAADDQITGELVRAGLVRPEERILYAYGKLILIARGASLQDATSARVAALVAGGSGRIALANPATAPYGLAAQRTLEALDLWQLTRGRRAVGQNAAQVLQYFLTGNVDYAFVSLGQWHNGGAGSGHSYWRVPQALYPPLRQEAVLLARSAHRPAASDFLHFLHSAEVRQLLLADGYGVEP